MFLISHVKRLHNMALFSHKRTENSNLDTIKTENMFSLRTSSCLQKTLSIHKFYTLPLFSVKDILNTPFPTCNLKVNTLEQFMHLFLSCVFLNGHLTYIKSIVSILNSTCRTRSSLQLKMKMKGN